MYTEEVNKIALSSGDDKRLETFDRITTFSHRTPVVKVCQSEVLNVRKVKVYGRKMCKGNEKVCKIWSEKNAKLLWKL